MIPMFESSYNDRKIVARLVTGQIGKGLVVNDGNIRSNMLELDWQLTNRQRACC